MLNPEPPFRYRPEPVALHHLDPLLFFTRR